MRIGATSDIHGNVDGLDFSDCDIGIFAGDLTATHGFSMYDMRDQYEYVESVIGKLCEKYDKTEFFIIPGNHDLFADPSKLKRLGAVGALKPKLPHNAHFLVNEACEWNGIKFFGLSWVPYINGMWAYEDTPIGRNLENYCSYIPEDTHVLITHSPPRFPDDTVNIDVSLGVDPRYQEHFGSETIYNAIESHEKLKYVFCGHIHSGDHNPTTIPHIKNGIRVGETIVCNVSRVDESYKIAYPIVNFAEEMFPVIP